MVSHRQTLPPCCWQHALEYALKVETQKLNFTEIKRFPKSEMSGGMEYRKDTALNYAFENYVNV